MEKSYHRELPEAFTSDSDSGMCYEKKVIIFEEAFFHQSLTYQIEIIEKLLHCMKESNKINEHDFPYYQLRVRPTRYWEFPSGICFELRWGNRKMLNAKKKEIPE